MPVYSIDVKIYATAYIRAESAEEAQKVALSLADSSLDMPTGYIGDDLEISDEEYDSDELPDVSLSPAMTIVGPDEGDKVTLASD